MRWNRPEHGSVRWVRKFALLPTTVETKRVWLERYWQKQEYEKFHNTWWNQGVDHRSLEPPVPGAIVHEEG